MYLGRLTAMIRSGACAALERCNHGGRSLLYKDVAICYEQVKQMRHLHDGVIWRAGQCFSRIMYNNYIEFSGCKATATGLLSHKIQLDPLPG